MLLGCKPYNANLIENIGPNETAWLIPLDANSSAGQAKFNSVAFLDQKKVSLKRVTIPQTYRSTGYTYGDAELIPTARLIKVDRSLVTREWTDNLTTGTTAKREGITVMTGDSVKLHTGLTITATILEEDASTYLYFHGEKPLHDVIDQNVRSFAVAELTKMYASMPLSEVQTNTAYIYNKLFEDSVEKFKAVGITISFLGNAEGLTYEDPKVQEAINRRYMAEQSIKIAQMDLQAQEVINKKTISIAKAQSDAAKMLVSDPEAVRLQNELKVKLILAEAQLAMSTNWNGKLPESIIPSDSPLLFNLSPSTKK